MNHQLACMLFCLAANPLAVASPPPAVPIIRVDGVAHDADGRRLLYRESHWLYRDDGQQRHLVLFRCPDGKAFGRKLLLGEPSEAAPDFAFVDARDGYEEGVRRQGGRRYSYFRAGRDQSLETAELGQAESAVIDAGFDNFVRTHWQPLMDGEELAVDFLIPRRGKYLRFRFSDARIERSDGHSTLLLKLRLDAWYAFAAPSIALRYNVENQRLLQFIGPGTIRDSRGRQHKVRVDFPAADAAREVDQGQLVQALEQPLEGDCAR